MATKYVGLFKLIRENSLYFSNYSVTHLRFSMNSLGLRAGTLGHLQDKKVFNNLESTFATKNKNKSHFKKQHVLYTLKSTK